MRSFDTDFKIQLNSLDDTKRLAYVFSKNLTPGLIIGLQGPLGVGKTEFVRALLENLQVTGKIVSPSFVFECQYRLATDCGFLPGGMEVFHWDLYRWTEQVAPEDLLDAITRQDSLVIVEWPEKCSQIEQLVDVHLLMDYSVITESDREEELPRVATLRCSDKIFSDGLILEFQN